MVSLVSQAKQLLAWNREKLRYNASLAKSDLSALFAANFVVRANGRVYQANHDSYFEFLESFRSTIVNIEYAVQEYIVQEPAVVMPLTARVERLDGSQQVFEAVLLVKYDHEGKIIHWQEVYVESDPAT